MCIVSSGNGESGDILIQTTLLVKKIVKILRLAYKVGYNKFAGFLSRSIANILFHCVLHIVCVSGFCGSL